MEPITDAKGIRGMLQTFVKIINECEEKNSVAFIGLPFTCTPFIDLFTYAIRDITTETYYITSKKKDDVVKLTLGDFGTYPEKAMLKKADIIVIMGGVAMPNNDWTPEDVNALIDEFSHDNTTVIGACFMNMFEKAGWLDKVKFDYMEDCFLSTNAC